jgi:hypothetical protein
MIYVGVLIIIVFAGALVWDFLGQPTKFRHLGRRRGSIGRSKRRPSSTPDKPTDVDGAA